MKAIVIAAYGGPEVLTVTELPDPVPAGEILIRVRAFGLNHAETYMGTAAGGRWPRSRASNAPGRCRPILAAG